MDNAIPIIIDGKIVSSCEYRDYRSNPAYYTDIVKSVSGTKDFELEVVPNKAVIATVVNSLNKVQSGLENYQITLEDWIVEVNKRLQAIEDKSKEKYKKIVESQID